MCRRSNHQDSISTVIWTDATQGGNEESSNAMSISTEKMAIGMQVIASFGAAVMARWEPSISTAQQVLDTNGYWTCQKILVATFNAHGSGILWNKSYGGRSYALLARLTH